MQQGWGWQCTPFTETATLDQATVQPAWGPSATWWLLLECPGVLTGQGGLWLPNQGPRGVAEVQSTWGRSTHC